ncbi:hypothetical protein ACG7TL_007017 [Trametes sanguinea]
MAAYNALSHGMSASALAGPVLTQRSSKMISLAPSPSLLPTPSFTPLASDHRPNKAELEARLAGAHARAYTRRLRQALALGHGKPPSSAAPQRTTRAAASSFQDGDATANTTTTTPSTTAGAASPLFRVAFPQAGMPSAFQVAPSPSMLPPPPPTPRPLFPRRRSRAPVRGPVVGLGLSFGASLSFSEEDAPLTPHHVFPDTLRRTPGAPLRAKKSQESAAGASYFHLPADILSPAPGGRGQQAVGLGILNLDFGQETGVQQPFPVLL